MADVLFVVNPAAGAGAAAREWSANTSWLPSTGLSYEAALTTRPMEATEITERAVRQSRPVVVAVGGDGTLNEVVNGFFHNGAPIPTTTRLAMVPLGTGGDFRRTLRIPLDPKAAVQVLQTGVARRLDAGAVSFRTPDNKAMNVVVDGVSHDLKAMQVVIANCQYFGGGMRMAPTASPTDGVFDVILVGDAGKIETIQGLGTISRGAHLDEHNPKYQLMYGKRISINCEQDVRIDLDGEDPGFLPALFEIQPGAIEFITPR